MSRIVLASTDEQYETHIREAFDGTLNGQLRRCSDDLAEADPAAVVAELAHDGPDVVAFGADVPIDVALKLARFIDRDRPEITVMLVTKPTQKLWEQAMRAGVDVVLPVDAEPDELREELEQALEVADRRRANLGSEAEPGGNSHRVIVVTSPKGGAGKSVVATNLAAGLAQVAPGKVAIVDLDLQFGDVAGAFQLMPERSIADAARAPGLDLTSLKVFLTPHPQLDLYTLCAPPTPAAADDISAERVAEIVQFLSEEFRYVVVDTSSGITEHALAVFDLTTDFVLVGNMDVPSVRALRKEVDVLDELGLVRPVRHFVLNRSDSRVGLDQRDVEATVGLQVEVAVPSSRAVPQSLNQGTPVMVADPRSPVAKALMGLVGRFAEVPAASSASEGRRSRRRNAR